MRKFKTKMVEIMRVEGDTVVLRSRKNPDKVLGRYPFGPGKKYKTKEAAMAACKKQEGAIHAAKMAAMEDDGGLSTYQILSETCPIRVRTLEESAGENIGFADLALVTPGLGNKRDMHYYQESVLRRDAGVFDGVKLHSTNHKDHSTDNWVATVVEAGKRFLQDGTPVVRIGVHREDFWRDLKNLKKLGLLEKMESSILAGGLARKGKVGGQDVNVVEAIKKAVAIDFVPKGGAGGRVLQLVESAVGDLDLLTAELLKERRPDLFEEITRSAGQSAVGDDGTIFEEDNSMEVKELEGRLKEFERELVELKEAHQTVVQERDQAVEALAEAEEAKIKTTAVRMLHKLNEEREKPLPKAAIVRITDDIESGEWELDASEPEIRQDVEELINAEAEYLKSLTEAAVDEKKSADVTDMYSTYQEDAGPSNGQVSNLREADEKIDTLIERFSGLKTNWAASQYGGSRDAVS